jgi:FtsH-binding integral membrane protein
MTFGSIARSRRRALTNADDDEQASETRSADRRAYLIGVFLIPGAMAAAFSAAFPFLPGSEYLNPTSWRNLWWIVPLFALLGSFAVGFRTPIWIQALLTLPLGYLLGDRLCPDYPDLVDKRIYWIFGVTAAFFVIWAAIVQPTLRTAGAAVVANAVVVALSLFALAAYLAYSLSLTAGQAASTSAVIAAMVAIVVFVGRRSNESNRSVEGFRAAAWTLAAFLVGWAYYGAVEPSTPDFNGAAIASAPAITSIGVGLLSLFVRSRLTNVR